MTKKLIILTCLTACSLALADDAAVHRGHGGVDLFIIKNGAKGTDTDGNIVSIIGTGKAVGFKTGYDYIKPNSIYFGFGGGYHYGTVDSKYAVMKEDGLQGMKGEFAVNIRQLEGRVGYTHQINPGLTFVPFVGISYQYSGSRSLSGYGMPSTSSQAGEGLIGAYCEYALAENISIGLNGTKYSAFRIDYTTAQGTTTFNTAEPTYELGFPITMQFVAAQGDKFQVNLEPYIQRQLDSKGDRVSGARVHLSCDF